jgi:hypothetical protein
MQYVVLISQMLACKYNKHGNNGGCGNVFESKESYEAFRTRMAKGADQSISTIFVKQLMQVPGCSVMRAKAVVTKYTTPAAFVEALHEVEADEATNLVASLSSEASRIRIGPVIGKRIARAFRKASTGRC